MQVEAGIGNFIGKTFKNIYISKQETGLKQTAFGSSENGITYEQAEAMKSQRINLEPLKNDLRHITEKDINFGVCINWLNQIQGNTQKVFDCRSFAERGHGIYWNNHFDNPIIFYNQNSDEKNNGDFTALVIPLHPQTKAQRNGDNFTILINGKIPRQKLYALCNYLADNDILNKDPEEKISYYLNAKDPKIFMDQNQSEIKKLIANFFNQSEDCIAK